ncbi:hypothetical protein PROFUN_06998 [Planoprotostelium fungivorum]|uniref:Selenoprotein O n=1 Tax=Planoprotostelium fungivorum TaxID=1890364 RepID=A0A2P6NMV0_9EUKA|nr:hypothetical protein PROFUN_06998 [Planoprotostelium fungivorum]
MYVSSIDGSDPNQSLARAGDEGSGSLRLKKTRREGVLGQTLMLLARTKHIFQTKHITRPLQLVPNRNTMSEARKLEDLRFDNSVLRELPLDTEKRNFTRQVRNANFSLVDPTPVENPQIVGYSESALGLLGITPSEIKRKDIADYFCGNKLLNGSQTAAHCYCGHQFGNFAGQLGDGRAMYLGEIINEKGERWEIQLKGAGTTPYSRSADGRAVLRSSIREFLCSEAMFHLGVPTTRAGTLVTSDSYAVRDPLYDGHPIKEHCAIVSRIAPSFIRFGSFQIALPTDKYTGQSGPSPNNVSLIRGLLDYVIKYHHRDIMEQPEEKRYDILLARVAEATAEMVAGWQTVGFAHGVMNTDNMSILGLTIDYGPFGWLEFYDPNYICNHSDHEGRYSFGNQVSMCRWNLEKLSQVIFVDKSDAEDILKKHFDDKYQKLYYDKIRQKLGLYRTEEEKDGELIEELIDTLQSTCADMTNSLRLLSSLLPPFNTQRIDELLPKLLSQCSDANTLADKSMPSMSPQEIQMFLRLPAEVLRAVGKTPEMVKKQVELLQKYHELQGLTDEEKKERDAHQWRAFLVHYAERCKREVEGAGEDYIKERAEKMNSVNPKFVLRNHLAQEAIEAAEKGDYTEFWSLYEVLKKPFEEHLEKEDKGYDRLQPAKAAKCVKGYKTLFVLDTCCFVCNVSKSTTVYVHFDLDGTKCTTKKHLTGSYVPLRVATEKIDLAPSLNEIIPRVRYFQIAHACIINDLVPSLRFPPPRRRCNGRQLSRHSFLQLMEETELGAREVAMHFTTGFAQKFNWLYKANRRTHCTANGSSHKLQ